MDTTDQGCNLSQYISHSYGSCHNHEASLLLCPRRGETKDVTLLLFNDRYCVKKIPWFM